MSRLVPTAAYLLATPLLLAGCALMGGDGSGAEVRTAVDAVAVPSGWTEPGDAEAACASVNLDCQDVSVRRLFHTDGSAAQACADVVAYAAAAHAFPGATGIRGTEERTPATEDCTAELAAYQRYLVMAPGPSGQSTAQWRLRLTPAATGYDLSVVLGDPPRDPWT